MVGAEVGLRVTSALALGVRGRSMPALPLTASAAQVQAALAELCIVGGAHGAVGLGGTAVALLPRGARGAGRAGSLDRDL